MEVTVDQALKQALEAHKAGELVAAERLYRAIIGAQPSHPDANHNLGVLALTVGKTQEALHYLETALESNCSQGQYWVSYIYGLIEAKRLNDARRVFEDGKKLGLLAEKRIKQLEQRLTVLQQGPSQQQTEELVSSYNAANYALAEAQAKALTNKFPNHAFGWNLLGAVLKKVGRLEESLEPMRQSVRLAPSDAVAHNNLGVTLSDLGYLTESEASYREAIRLKPDFAGVHYNLANTLIKLGRLNDAKMCYLESIRLNPDHAETHSNLGNALKASGRLNDAKMSYLQAIRLKPGLADVHNNLGIVLKDLGCLSQAEASYRDAIRLNPDYSEAHYNLGNALKDSGRLTEAEVSYRQAINLKPDHAGAHCNLGNALNEMGRLTEAEASYREAIRFNPDFSGAHCNLGNALTEMGRLTEAEASYREAILLKPDLAAAHSNLGILFKDLGRFAEAEASYREAICLKPDLAEAHSNLLFCMNYVESLSPEAALVQAKEYGIMVSTKSEPKFSSWHIEPQSTKLRIGFVSGDFRNHPVGYFIEGLVKHLDQNQFEAYAFLTTPKTDDLTERLMPHFHAWCPIYGKNDFEAASIIRNQKIHVLIDLSGHTAHNRLPVFAYKPAPVQASWLGYFATTGLIEMDYFLGDPIMSPESEVHRFTEKISNLPETWLCLTPPVRPVSISPLPALTNGYVTFGCFGNFSKMNDLVLKTWSQILKRVPNSKLLLKSKQLGDERVVSNVQRQFSRQGLSMDQLILEGFSSREAYFMAYNRVDIILDTFPYPGGTTSVDALWMGVPVLTLKGDRFLSRLGESIATNAGQYDWIAKDLKDYVRKAFIFASDRQKLVEIRSGLRARVLRSPLFDSQRFARCFGETLRDMWGSRSVP